VLARHRVPVRAGWGIVAARAGADGAVASVEIARLDAQWCAAGRRRTLAVDAVCASYGFTPALELALDLGCRAVTDPADGQPVIQVDGAGRSSIEGVFVAGEATGVGGAALARVEGSIAGRAAAGDVMRGRLSPVSVDNLPLIRVRRASLPLIRVRRASLSAFAAALRRAHAIPAGWPRALPDETIVCRCEEVSAGALRSAVRELGVTDARSAKLVTRAGMGLCQGRMCGANVADVLACELGHEISDRTALATRPLAEPVPLAELAQLACGAPEDL
jgi:hypothetical protein